MARTARKDLIEQEKHKAKKVARTMIRLKYSLMADDVLNDAIPAIDDAVDVAIAEGTSWEFDVSRVISDAIEVAMPALGSK